MKRHLSKIAPRKKDTHKGDFGHVLVVAGSRGMTGAAFLSSQAALLAGSGLVTCAVPRSLNTIMEIKLTEGMTLPLPETKDGTIARSAEGPIMRFSAHADVLAIGPGLSRNTQTQAVVAALLKRSKKPIVLDADGITAVAKKATLLKRKAPTVITPHPGEMSRLIGTDARDIQKTRGRVAVLCAQRYGTVVVLKGYRTVVATPHGDLYVNRTGNSGMSTAGVGDVLTGVIASFMGQGIDAYSAAVIGVYLHGLAGDIAAREKGQFSLMATDVLNRIPDAIRKTL